MGEDKCCLFCQSRNSVKTFYHKFSFNRKTFSYVRCADCNLFYLDPLPDRMDYEAMYTSEYQQNEVDGTIVETQDKKLPGLRFSYGFQFELMRKFVKEPFTILDYGCGNGNFAANAFSAGLVCDGAEFNKDYVLTLSAGLPHIKFYTIGALFEKDFCQKYDVIRLSNVLEHLTDPIEVLAMLAEKLKPQGILLVEGPIEANFSIAGCLRNLYFKTVHLLRPGRTIDLQPYHIFLSDATNQQYVFEAAGYEKSVFMLDENHWPFPVPGTATNIKQKIMSLIGSFSILVNALFNKPWGNTFIYIGRPKK